MDSKILFTNIKANVVLHILVLQQTRALAKSGAQAFPVVALPLQTVVKASPTLHH